MTSNANNHKYKSGVIEQSTRIYEKALHEELTRDRELNPYFSVHEFKEVGNVVGSIGITPNHSDFKT